jgi:hypothetical protein
MATDKEEPHSSLGAAGHAALGAAGEAAAYFAGAPIAGAADAAIGLGDAVSEREAKLEEAITGRHEPEVADIDEPARASRPLLWVVLAVLAGLVLVWLFRPV